MSSLDQTAELLEEGEKDRGWNTYKNIQEGRYSQKEELEYSMFRAWNEYGELMRELWFNTEADLGHPDVEECVLTEEETDGIGYEVADIFLFFRKAYEASREVDTETAMDELLGEDYESVSQGNAQIEGDDTRDMYFSAEESLRQFFRCSKHYRSERERTPMDALYFEIESDPEYGSEDITEDVKEVVGLLRDVIDPLPKSLEQYVAEKVEKNYSGMRDDENWGTEGNDDYGKVERNKLPDVKVQSPVTPGSQREVWGKLRKVNA